MAASSKRSPPSPPPLSTAPPPYRPRSSTTNFDPTPLKSALRSRRPKPPEVIERERLVLQHLPPADARSKPIRNFLWTLIYKLLLFTLHLSYSIYLRIRWAYSNAVNRAFSVLYYHHRTPELIQKDVAELKKKGKFPRHLSVVLEYEKDGLDRLIDETAEIACWCAATGIVKLSVYERSGILKSYVSTSHRAIAEHLRSYFGKGRPTLRVHAPHSRSFANGDVPSDDADRNVDLEVIFLSEEDGRESIVDLTKTLCDMAQRGKISAEDVSVELVDAELKAENVMDEPDLLILFSPNVTLKGYPPWHIRLTEIFNVQDNEGVGYQVFLRALHCFARTEFRFGR